jgi:hypothetical protein
MFPFFVAHIANMLIRSNSLLLLASLALATSTLAQQNTCGTDALMQRLRAQDPEAAYQESGMNAAIREQVLQGARGGGQHTIPVVVHIVHDNGNENISDALVQQGIADLNDAFANSGAYQIAGGVDVGINFCLAQQDPDGLPTTGITRHVSPLTEMFSETQDLQLKNITRWDPTRYLNVWLIREITSVSTGAGVAGYAYFPQAHGGPSDGIVNEARWWGSSADNSKIHIHEAGHYLGLYHTFEGGCVNNDCLNDGDRVCDTPPDASTAPVICGNPTNSCTTDADDTSPNNPFRPVAMGGLGDRPDLTNAYMDYGLQQCQDRFTQGQAERMAAALTTTRFSLLSSPACLSSCGAAIIAMGIADGAEYVQGQSAAINPNVQATVPVTYAWSIGGNVLATTQTFNANLIPFGTHTLTCTVTNPAAACSIADSVSVTIRCTAPATINYTPTSIQPGATVNFTAYAPGNQGLQWFIDGLPAGTGSPFQTSFPESGLHTVFVVAFNGSCHDTSAVRPFMVGECTQGQYLNWMSLSGKRINFGVDPPVVQNVTSTPYFHTNEGYSCISDMQGREVVYCNGQLVWGRNHQMMPNGDGLLGGVSALQGSIIVPNPAMNGLYYVFTTDNAGGATPTNNNGVLAYSIVDLALNNGNGDVTEKNIILHSPITERLTAIRHCNGHDIWVLAHEFDSDAFLAYLVTDAGVNEVPVVSNVGLVNANILGDGVEAIGYMKPSPMGDKVAYTCPYGKYTEVLKFDCATGVLSDPIELWQPADKGYFGLEFSPDGTNLYVSEFRYANEIPYIWQFELDTHNATAVNASRTPLGGPWVHNGNCSMTLGPDDRIHVGVAGVTGMYVIPYPNSEGSAAGFQANWLQTAFFSIGMNNHLVENRSARTVSIAGPTQVCNGTSGVSYTVECAHPAKNQWIYNGPNTVVSNTAGELVLDFTTGGVDTLVAVKLNDCYGDHYDTLFIHVDLQLPLLPADTTLCAGSTLEISPGTGYATVEWQDGSTTPTFTATGPGTYIVTVTSLGGCSLSDTMEVTELPNTLTVDLGNDTSYCYNHGITLHVPTGHAPPYLWSTGATTPSIMHGSFHTSIWLQVTDANGCLARDTINLTPWSNQPAIYLGPDVSICPGEVVVLNAQLLYGTDPVYTWNNGTAGPSLTVDVPGTYWLTAVGPCGFANTDTINVVECISTALDGPDANGAIRAWPNPTDGLLQIATTNGAVLLDVEVLNTLGQSVLHSTDPSGTLDLRHLSTGVYTLRVRLQQGEVMLRVVRE